MSFYLFRSDGNIKTPSSKSDLLTEIRVITTLKSVPLKENSAVIIDFMAHARKVMGKKNKFQIRTFGDWVEHLWTSLLSINEATKQIDIVFDLYLETSRKDGEQKSRASTCGIKTNIHHKDQPIPAEMNEFWACSENKVQLQQFFIHWLQSTYNHDKQVYLGGSHEGDIYECYMLQNSSVQTVDALRRTHEEADQCMHYNIDHAVNNSVENVLVSSGATYVFVSLMFNFFLGNVEVWQNCGSSTMVKLAPSLNPLKPYHKKLFYSYQPYTR